MKILNSLLVLVVSRFHGNKATAGTGGDKMTFTQKLACIIFGFKLNFLSFKPEVKRKPMQPINSRFNVLALFFVY